MSLLKPDFKPHSVFVRKLHWNTRQIPDRKKGIFDSSCCPIPSGGAFEVQPAELVVVLASNFCLQKLTPQAARQGEANARIRKTVSGWNPFNDIIPRQHAIQLACSTLKRTRICYFFRRSRLNRKRNHRLAVLKTDIFKDDTDRGELPSVSAQ